MLNNVPTSEIVQSQAKQAAMPASAPSVVEALQQRAPNYRHKDGRIYASREGESYVAVSVSPLHRLFDTQIEPGVKPIVDALIAKNFMPISSCQGHGGPLFVKLAADKAESAGALCAALNVIPYVEASILSEPFFNVKQQIDQTSGHVSFARAHIDAYVAQHEQIKEVNALYLRSYTKLWFVDITLYKHPGWWLHPIGSYRAIADRRKNKQLRKHQIVYGYRDNA